MRLKSCLAFAGILPTLCLSAPSSAATPIVAVFDVEAKSQPRTFKSTLADYLATQLAASGHYEVVPRSDLKRRLRNQKRDSYKACYDESCQIEVGKELAADSIVSAQLIEAGAICILMVKVFDLRRATTSNAAAIEGACKKEAIFKMASQVVKKLAPRAKTEDAAQAGPMGFGFAELTSPLRSRFAVPWDVDSGVVVMAVREGSPAALAGLGVGDVVTTAKVWNMQNAALIPAAKLHALDEIDLDASKQFEFMVWSRGSFSTMYIAPAGSGQNRLGRHGMQLATLTTRTRDAKGIPYTVQGAIVRNIADDSSAEISQLKVGDIITGAAIPTATSYKDVPTGALLNLSWQDVPDRGVIILKVWRNGRTIRLHLKPAPVADQKPKLMQRPVLKANASNTSPAPQN